MSMSTTIRKPKQGIPALVAQHGEAAGSQRQDLPPLLDQADLVVDEAGRPDDVLRGHGGQLVILRVVHAIDALFWRGHPATPPVHLLSPVAGAEVAGMGR